MYVFICLTVTGFQMKFMNSIVRRRQKDNTDKDNSCIYDKDKITYLLLITQDEYLQYLYCHCWTKWPDRVANGAHWGESHKKFIKKISEIMTL